jgi:hypothetical protein
MWGTAGAAGAVALPVAAVNTNYNVTTSDGAIVTAKALTGFTVSTGCDWRVSGVSVF